jgi:hypothetical protein
MAGPGPRLAHRDAHQELPELGRAVDGELALGVAAEKGAEHGLDDVLAVHPAGQFAAKVLFGHARELAGVPGVELLRRLRVAGAPALDQVGKRDEFFHENKSARFRR